MKWGDAKSGAAGGAASPIPEVDKAAVRDNLLEGIVRAPPLVRAQLGECLKSVVYADFPDAWPGILPAVTAQLATQARARGRAPLRARGPAPCPSLRRQRAACPHRCRRAAMQACSCIRPSPCEAGSARAAAAAERCAPAPGRAGGRAGAPLRRGLAACAQEQARMRGGLYALRILARKYEFKDEEERGPLAPIVAGFLPPLLQILQARPRARAPPQS